MNALAADQEKRFAEAVLTDPALKAAGIRVGNYTGRYDPADPGAGADSGTKELGRKEGRYHGISSHAKQLENPPDILLTNYKMLDFLLMRPQDQKLWRFNESGELQYLVLDELQPKSHSYSRLDYLQLSRVFAHRVILGPTSIPSVYVFYLRFQRSFRRSRQ